MGKPLQKGSTGRPVARVQRQLINHGHQNLKNSGVFDADTEAAVRRFQKSMGFGHRDVNGIVGNKTTAALFRTFKFEFKGHLLPELYDEMPDPFTRKSLDLKYHGKVDDVTGSPPPAEEKPELPETLTANWQFGYQKSRRDGKGYQFQLSLTARTRSYFVGSDLNAFYHDTHLEVIPQVSLGIPIAPGSSIYTGQIGVTIQPITDWFLLEGYHLLIPSVGVAAQIPLNAANGSIDPSSGRRFGINLGGTLIQVKVNKQGWLLSLSCQEAGYHDFRDNKFHWDPSCLAAIQGNFW
jgi:peptidoglycan hydrolase-like protein with peptidoglycan-binding domain